MATSTQTKRDKQFGAARKIAIANGEPFLDPEILFSGASLDDLNGYTAEMLAMSSVHAAAEIAAWDRNAPRVSLVTLEHVEVEGSPVHVMAITNQNMPFLYDSVMGEITSMYRDIVMAVHPILVMEPNQEITLFSPDEKSKPKHRFSHIQIHLASMNKSDVDGLVQRVHTVLDQVSIAVRDWPGMIDILESATSDVRAYNATRKKSDRNEAVAFLSWLKDGNFTFLGMREYTYSGKGENAVVERGKGRGLGILSDPDVLVLRFGKDAVTTTPEILAFLEGPDFLIVTKANVKSVVHRRAYMDYIGVKRFDTSGQVIGELRIVGLFTSSAYTQSATTIPLLRSKLTKVIEHFGYDPAGHSGKTLLNTLESYPRDDLFQIDTDLLISFCEQITDLGDRPRIRVLPRIDRFDRFVSVIIYVPREQYDSELREKIGQYLKTIYDGRVSAYYPAFPEGGVARVHFIIGRSGGKTPKIAQAVLESAVKNLATRWDERFDALTGESGPKIRAGQDYQADFSPAEAFQDMGPITACVQDGTVKIALHPIKNGGTGTFGLKIFHPKSHLALSRRVPLLENLGFDVISEKTFDIQLNKGDGPADLVVLHDMELKLGNDRIFDLARQSARVEQAFLAAFHQEIDNDTFNHLVLNTQMNAREVVVLRAYARYLRQAGIAYSQDYIAATLNKYPTIAENLFQLFHSRFDPRIPERQRQKKHGEISETIEKHLAEVPVLDEDRILRRYLNVINATLRTNYFQTEADGSPRSTLAIKFDPKAIEGLPEPRPFREIFVYGAEVEGVHLRFGKVARGGLRWSDRAQDYRTEVLGLVKAQQVKNAVIVPVGAKGGFFPKRLPANGSRDEVFNAGRDAYKTFIRTLLSITDNLDGAAVVPPANTVRLDGDDPYFVVAADKGTATFSDTANGIAQDLHFWLDDAFASGGSVGYDHKKMGITARGAWEAVKRHFREMDIDIQTTPFSVVGVGDMSGDVFGNGMLLSPKIRLIAAFDHRDIFIDPDPDMALGLAERQRLFALPRSSWQDYNKDLLSQGGMIIPRNVKSVTLTAEAAAALAMDRLVATPFEILSAILKAPVDLLWFGGIGTYIKAGDENDADVGDRANDAIRVLATEVRAKVIGEGANLGVTAKARIAYGLNGGRCNSDAIDNSAGVNSSDIEVNIKIALANAMRENRLTRPDRDALLATMTDEVAALVLRNNYLQTLAISLVERQGIDNGRDLARFMTRLTELGELNRKVENLPDDATMTERYGMGKYLTRAEIGILLSYAKISLFDDLIAGKLPDDPWFDLALTQYFPAKMQETYASDIKTHRLHREIIATSVANHVINRGGPAFVTSLMDMTGATATDIAKAAIYVRDSFSLPDLWARIDQLDGKISGSVQNQIYAAVAELYFEATHTAILTKAVTGPLAASVLAMQSAVTSLKPRLDQILSDDLKAETAQIKMELMEQGVPDDLAHDISLLTPLATIPEIAVIARESGEALEKAAISFMAVTDLFRISDILLRGSQLQSIEMFEEQALSHCLEDVALARRNITTSILRLARGAKDPVQSWREASAATTDMISRQMTGLLDTGDMSLAKIVVASGALTNLANGIGK
jgi:glutamate dehydrogenase